MHTHAHGQWHARRVMENLDFSSSLISLFRLKAPAASACCRTLNTSHELYVNMLVCVCVGGYVSFNACVKGPKIYFPLTQKVSLSLLIWTHSFWISWEEIKLPQHQFTHSSPFVPVIVILTTMSPVFQVFAHSSSLLLTVDLPGHRRQRAWSMSLPAVLDSKGMTPLSLSPLLSLIAFSQWRENVR